MNLGDVPIASVSEALSSTGLLIDFGAARARVRADLEGFAPVLQSVYRHFPLSDASDLADVTVALRRARGLRRIWRPQIELFIDGSVPFEPFPADTHLPLLEWGLNWCIADRLNEYLLLHAGVLERDGFGIVLPALPGSGKSTLSAALSLAGYRLLSDEFGVVTLGTSEQRGHGSLEPPLSEEAPVKSATGSVSLVGGLRLLPLVRPVALKNESIDVIARTYPNAVVGPRFPKTRKGTVAHLAPLGSAAARCREPARPLVVLFPKFVKDSGTILTELPKAQAFAKLATNAFNYQLLGARGFETVHELIEQSTCYRLEFGRLEGALAAIDQIFGEADRARRERDPEAAPA